MPRHFVPLRPPVLTPSPHFNLGTICNAGSLNATTLEPHTSALALPPTNAQILTALARPARRYGLSWNPPAGLAPGKVIAIDMLGGTLLEWGQPVSYLLSPRPYSLKPGHSYLIQTYFHSTGDFYSDPRSWDISNGTVKPNDPGEAAREKLGTSQIDGTPASQIVSRMKAILVTR